MSAPLDILRQCRFSPYRKGMGPRFALTMYATRGRDSRGQTTIGYVLTMINGRTRTILFSGEDFHGSPMDADDSDQTVASLMVFLTLRPGDTDSEYFDRYTPEQLAYCDAHAEALDCEVQTRFGEDGED